ncbi:MAG: hypothetical protein K2J77_05985 [Oscillospiraceae bacterium]|nr:hypothetical protein [Oscillospiraceae bacterium]
MDKGQKILLKLYREFELEKSVPLSEQQKADFELAKSEGYMFDPPQPITHEEAMKRLSDVMSKISREDVANAFLYSLSTRRLEYRSALASYYYAVSIPKHENVPDGYGMCSVCGFKEWKRADQSVVQTAAFTEGFNSLNYQRYKYGGSFGIDFNFALFDLEQFVKLPRVSPCDEDIAILKRILGCVSKLACWRDKVAKLQKAVIHERILKTNSDEMSRLLEALGICGVLTERNYPALEEKFVTFDEIRSLQFSEWDYPINMWRAYCGVNKERLLKVFGLESD